MEKQHEFAFPIKEIEVYAEKLSLEEKLKELESENDEKEHLIDRISLKNNQLCKFYLIRGSRSSKATSCGTLASAFI